MRRVELMAAGLTLLAGCDVLFGVDPGGGGDGVADARAEGDGGLDARDDDGDGVADADDNCLGEPNPDQHDEDDDRKGDACDLCPYVFSGPTELEVDADGDGVGARCDLDDDTTGHTWSVFEAFSPAFAPVPCVMDPPIAGWGCNSDGGGALIASGDALRFPADADRQLFWGGPNAIEARVDAGFRIVTVSTMDGFVRVMQFFSTNGDAAPEGSVTCSVDYDAVLGTYSTQIEHFTASGGSDISSGPAIDSTSMALRLEIGPAGSTCVFNGAPVQKARTTGVIVGPAVAWAKGVEADLEYFAVVVRR